MNIFKQMLQEKIFNDTEESLMEMRDIINQMVTELYSVKKQIDFYLEDLTEFPVNHKLLLKDNEVFRKLYNEYDIIVGEL